MLDDVREEEDVLKPLNGLIRWIDCLALGCIIKLIERLPCLWLKLKVFRNIERIPTSGSKELTTNYLLIYPIFGK